MSYESLDLTVDASIAQLTLRGTGKGNVLGPAFFDELPRALAELASDDAVRVIVLRGQGETFSYGLDLKAAGALLGPILMGPAGPKERTGLYDLIRRWQSAIGSLAACPKPVIAAVQGRCIGGGLDIVATCDVRICADDALFSLREVRVAMVADIGSIQRLPPIIGDAMTRELAMTGRDFGASEAKAMGLVSRVTTAAALDDEALALARSIAENPPLVVQGIKRMMNMTLDRQVQPALSDVALFNAAFLPSADLREAMMAFLEKRAPAFKGE